MRIRTAVYSAMSVLAPSFVLAAGDGGASHLPVTAWAIISFLIVLGIIWIKLMPMITTALDKRAATIRESLAAAEKARADAEAAMALHQDDLEKARHEARAIIEEGKADAERLREKIIADAQADAGAVADRAKREIELAKRAAIDELQQQSVALSLDLAGRLIQKSLSAKDHQDLIRERIALFKS